MKKTVISAIAVALCILIGGFVFLYLQRDNGPAYKNLYDENGLFSEENFVYNAALEKKGAHILINGETRFSIRYENEKDESVQMAIQDLREFFEKTGNGITAVASDGQRRVNTIHIGRFSDVYTPQTQLKKPGAYIIDIGENDIFIYAETVYGMTNGIYGFMEDYLGCMFFDDENTYIPPVKTMILGKKVDVQEPAFECRDVGDTAVWKGKTMDKKWRLRQDESYLTNGCHHSVGRVGKDILAAHPEYYAMVNGSRTATQLCFSNEEVIDLLEQAIVKEEQNKTNDQTVWWDISQQDNMDYCTCEKCSALIEEMGNAAAPIFRCVNIIAKRHPELKISTLAYHYGSTPPVNIKFEKNVMIKWCIMSSYGANDYSAPLSEESSPIAAKQYSEILGWTELVDNVYVWDYITNYFYYMLPFPCLDAMQGNIQLLKDRGVSGVFTLSSYNHRGSCDRLKANFAAHLLWNPDFDADKFMSRFWTLYLGTDAAPYIMQMYQIMQDETRGKLWVYDFPFVHSTDYLSKKNVDTYLGLLDQAFSACEGKETYLKRLRYEKISLLFTAIVLNYRSGDELKEMKKEFGVLCEEFSVKALNELSSYLVSEITG